MTEAMLIATGIAAGVFAAALGVGGGVIFVPAMVLLLGFEQHLAEGTSLAVIALTAAVGTAVHHRRGRVDWPVAAAIAAAGAAGAVAGAWLALRLDPTILRRLFAGLLVVVASRMIRSPGRRNPQPLTGIDSDVGS